MNILISIKEKWAEAILDGRKTLELRPVEGWNGHAYIHYEKRLWVYCPADARSLRAVLDFNKGRRKKGGKR